MEDDGYMIGKWNEDSSIYARGCDPMIFVFLLVLVSRNVYYLLIDVGRIVERRMKTYEKVWIKGVEWGGEKVDESMKEMKRSPSAHTLKGDGREEVVEDMWGKVWILGYRNPK